MNSLYFQLDTTPSTLISTNNTSRPNTSSDIAVLRDEITTRSATINVLEFYDIASAKTGGVVLFDQKYGFIPIIVGGDDKPILLYKFIEVLDELVDYDELQAEFPTLTFGQIAGAISFLRTLAQFNGRGIDVEDIENRLIHAETDLQATIEDSLSKQGEVRVLADNYVDRR